MQTILVIDDDNSLCDTIVLLLERDGFRTAVAGDGRTGLDQVAMIKPDLILVDLRLPVISGIEVCKHLRVSGVDTPIIVLSAIGGEMDKVLLLEIGADDYVVKPFGTRELLARIRAKLRRSGGAPPRKIMSFDGVNVDLEHQLITRLGQKVQFTTAEYNLLVFFLKSPNRVHTRETIMKSVWGYESCHKTRRVDAHVVRLRQKLENDPRASRHFLTVHRIGYRFLP